MAGSCIIVQQNLQRGFSATCEFGNSMLRRGASFALLQEPYFSNDRVRGLPAAMRVFSNLPGNAAVVISDLVVDCTVVSRTRWGICIEVAGDFGRLILASIYCPPGASLERYLGYMDTVLLHASNIPVILGLDANACSRMWFSKMPENAHGRPNYVRGEILSEWLLTKGVSVLNEASELYTFDGPMGTSDIDVTVANNVALSSFDFQWRVHDNAGVSDHNLIEIVVTYHRRSGFVPVQRKWRLRNFNSVGYAAYFRAVALGLSLDTFSALSVDEQVEQIDQWMCSVNDTLLDRCRVIRHRRVRWWTSELDSMRRSVRQLRRLFQRARRSNADDLVSRRAAYLASLRSYKAHIEKVKEDEWRTFVRENRDDPWGEVYRICGGRDRRLDVESLQVGDVVLTAWGDCMQALLGSFFPDGDQVERPPHNVEVVGPPSLERWELDAGFHLIRCKKSPGIDGMTGEMCKSIWKAIPEYLEVLYSRCISEGYFPGAYKRARVVVLLKSPDRVRSNLRSYRGISLLPVLGKVLERIMVTRLKDCDSAALSEFQFGFREGRSVEDAWLHVRHCVRESTGKYVLGIFVDFKGAFDYLLWDVVIDRLRSVGCQELALWCSYFSDRKACVAGASDTVWRDVVRGCPQGSICGPFIWNLMMDPLLRQLAESYKLCAYADDLLILIEGQSRAELERKGSQVMHYVSEWGCRVGVSVAMDKTVTMLLKGKLSHDRPPLIRSGGSSLRYVTKIKYLGIMMAERMNFLVHPVYVRDKLIAVVGRVRRILRSDWGLSRRAVRTIYGGLFVACATYGAPIWYEIALSVLGRGKILSCQRVAMIASMPVCRTVSTEALQVLLGAAPLDLEVIRRAIIFKVKKGLPLLAHDWISAIDVVGRDSRQIKAILDERLVSKWRLRWTDSDKGRVTYQFIRDADFVRARPDFCFNLRLGFLLTGHGSLNAFLHRRGLSESSECACGTGIEDWHHVLTVCPLYDDVRSFSNMGIVFVGGIYDFSRVVTDSRFLCCLGDFARVVFSRRLHRD